MDTLYTGSVTIRRPIKEVFHYAADLNNVPNWYPFYVRIEGVSRAASDFAESFTAHLTPLPWPSIRIDRTFCEPERKLSYCSWDVGLMCDVEFLATASGDTQVKAAISSFGWPAMMMGLFVQPLRMVGGDNVNLLLRNLKERIEATKVDQPSPVASPAPPNPPDIAAFAKAVAEAVVVALEARDAAKASAAAKEDPRKGKPPP